MTGGDQVLREKKAERDSKEKMRHIVNIKEGNSVETPNNKGIQVKRRKKKHCTERIPGGKVGPRGMS